MVLDKYWYIRRPYLQIRIPLMRIRIRLLRYGFGYGFPLDADASPTILFGSGSSWKWWNLKLILSWFANSGSSMSKIWGSRPSLSLLFYLFPHSSLLDPRSFGDLFLFLFFRPKRAGSEWELSASADWDRWVCDWPRPWVGIYLPIQLTYLFLHLSFLLL